MCERIGKHVKVLVLMCLLLVVPVWGFGIGKQVKAAETEKKEEPLSKEEYEKKFEEAVSLANMMLADETFVNNKTYTAEQEKDLEAIVTEVTQFHFVKSATLNAKAFAEYIRSHMTLSGRQQTNTWQMLCDGDAIGQFGEPQRCGDSENFVHAFRDLCVLEGIPCFMLKDESNGKVIAMYYAESGWCFLDVADPEGVSVGQTKVYETFHSSFEPNMITFEYDMLDIDTTSKQYVAEIYIDKEAMENRKDSNRSSFYLYYDAESNMVKMCNQDLLTDEYYYGTNQKSNANGEPPKGWVEAVRSSTKKVTVYRGYSLFGVALRGRFQVDGKEYTTEPYNLVNIPYGYVAEDRKATEEEKQNVLSCITKKRNRVEQIAETLYQDKTFIFDTKFTEEEEAFMRAAVEEATSREYLETKQKSLDAVGCTLPPEGEPLSEELKAYGILWYIRDHVQYAEVWYQSSYGVLKTGYAVCAGYALLMRDMCVLAEIPCFRLGCEIDYGEINGKNFSDHDYNMLRINGKWHYADPTNLPVIREVAMCDTTSFIRGYDTFNSQRCYVSKEELLKEIYPVVSCGYFYDFDANGKLGIYKTSRDDLMRNVTSGNDKAGFYGTDSNGKIAYGNGFFSFEKWETHDGLHELWRYEGYMQEGNPLQGKTIINGKEYNFDCMLVWRDGDVYNGCRKELLKRQYLISYMDFSAIPDQEYTGKAICPEPVIKHGDKILTPGVDYTITYKDNIELTNDYCVYTSYTVEGMGDYTGTAIRYFNIIKKDISNMEVSLPKEEYYWDRDAEINRFVKPKVSMDLPESEYVVNYKNNNTVGEATVVITGKNHCYGTITKHFQIRPAVFDEKRFRIVAANGEELPASYGCNSGQSFSIKPEIAVRWYNEDGTKYTTLGSNDYTVTYENTDKMGTATIRVQGIGKFSGTLEKHFTITEKEQIDIAQCKELMNLLQGKRDYTNTPRRYDVVYTGEPVLPYISGVSYITEYTEKPDDLEKDVDFTVTATNNINAGEGTLIVQGIGKYTGSVTITFDILPKKLTSQDIALETDRVAYNGSVQPPKVLISGLEEGSDFEVVCQKWAENSNTYENVEPVEAGYYQASIKLLNSNYTFDTYMKSEDGYYRMSYVIVESGWVPTPAPSKVPGATNGPGMTATPGAISTQKPEAGDTTKAPDITQNPEKTKAPSGQVTPSAKTPSATGKPATTKPKVTIPKVAKVTKWKATAKTKGFVLSWKKVSGTKGYQIQISTKKNFKGAKTISIKPSKTSYKASKLRSKQKYYIRIRAYKTYKDAKGKTKKVYGKWVTVTKKTK